MISFYFCSFSLQFSTIYRSICASCNKVLCLRSLEISTGISFLALFFRSLCVHCHYFLWTKKDLILGIFFFLLILANCIWTFVSTFGMAFLLLLLCPSFSYIFLEMLLHVVFNYWFDVLELIDMQFPSRKFYSL